MSRAWNFHAERTATRRIVGQTLALALVALSGCTIVKMRSDLQERQTRIDEKQQQLDSLRATNAELAAESDRLNEDLQRHELDAKELHERLDRLVKLNEAAQASSARQRAEQQERRRQLQVISQQAQELGHNTSLTDEEKMKKLEALRQSTRALLKVLLAG
jgi:septal ring factor EnvC (AmiA/AmiB activator)